MIYLKTYFYASHELNFIAANILESHFYVDKYIITEFSYTHTGELREKIGIVKLLEMLPDNLHKKIFYDFVDQCNDIVYAGLDSDVIHSINEPVMRSYFMNLYHFNDEDVIISVDADEIIYRESYPIILNELIKYDQLLITLNQFFYKINYLWKNEKFVAPTITKFKIIKNKYPCNIRYEGKLLEKPLGAHFSWCMNVDSMKIKLNSYSHPEYRGMANSELLENAVKNKIYPFDSNRNFQIEVIPKDSNIIPYSLRDLICD